MALKKTIKKLLSLNPDADIFGDEDEILDSRPVELLDDLTQALLSKHTDEDRTAPLTPPELTIMHAFGAWTIAMNGGASEAAACSEENELEKALTTLGAPDMAEGIRVIKEMMHALDEKTKDLSFEERDDAFVQLKIGDLSELDSMFYEPMDRVPRLVLKYLQVHGGEILVP